MTPQFEADFRRWCDLHSWYKHLPLEGMDFYLTIRKGEQPRNGIHPDVMDLSGEHLWFNERGDGYRRVRLGPFMTSNLERYHGVGIIVQRAGERFAPWLRATHPALVGLFTDWCSSGGEHPFITALYRAENQKYLETVAAAVPYACAAVITLNSPSSAE
jgi:hypothetical protein